MVAASVVAVLALGATLAFEPLLRRQVVSEARKRGVELTLGDVQFHFTSVSIDHATFRLIGSPALSGKLAHADVALSGLKPKSVTAHGLDLRVHGAPETVVLGLTDWFNRHASNFELPFSASHVTLEWSSGESTWFQLSGGAITPAPAGFALHATRASVAGIGLGAMDVGLDTKKSELHATLGSADSRSSPVRAVMAYAGEHPSADIQLKPVDVSRLGEILGVQLPLAGVHASGTAHASVDRNKPSSPVIGTAHLELIGFVPPHPQELDGIVFGDKTFITTRFELTSDRQRLVLRNVRLAAGAFRLGGTGLVTREARRAHIQLKLSGRLACTAVAGSAARSRLGNVVGAWLQHAAARALTGSVRVVVRIDAYTDHLAAAKVLRTISVGCGLKPLKAPAIQFPNFDLRKLGTWPALPQPSSPRHAPKRPSLPSPLRPTPTP